MKFHLKMCIFVFYIRLSFKEKFSFQMNMQPESLKFSNLSLYIAYKKLGDFKNNIAKGVLAIS